MGTRKRLANSLLPVLSLLQEDYLLRFWPTGISKRSSEVGHAEASCPQPQQFFLFTQQNTRKRLISSLNQYYRILSLDMRKRLSFQYPASYWLYLLQRNRSPQESYSDLIYLLNSRILLIDQSTPSIICSVIVTFTYYFTIINGRNIFFCVINKSKTSRRIEQRDQASDVVHRK